MAVKPKTESRAQSAAAPSPFPPIADYAFLSNCHTGALVAADGAIDWLCVPSFDSPSVFGSLLDRGAGFFRFAPFGINHPTARTYIPGTNVLETTWKTPSGWIVVRDALTMGARAHEDVGKKPGAPLLDRPAIRQAPEIGKLGAAKAGAHALRRVISCDVVGAGCPDKTARGERQSCPQRFCRHQQRGLRRHQ